MERSACPTCGSCSGMFTANSMNCLNEALGLALPGNGTMLATHADALGALRGGRRDGSSSWPGATTSTATTSRSCPAASPPFEAFENAMTLDIAMGGSTNTVLHLLAIAHEAGVDFTMQDIDRLSRHVPNICKVAPSIAEYHVEDVHRAGGIFTILGELDRAGLIHTEVAHRPRADPRRGDRRQRHPRGLGRRRGAQDAPAGAGRRASRPVAFSQDKYYDDARHRSRRAAASATVEHAYSEDGGLAVLYGNLAEDGCIVKTAGVDESIWHFEGPARVFQSPGGGLRRHPRRTGSRPGDVVVIRYEGPKGGPGMQEMLYPTSYLKSKKLGKACALITDGRFSGGTSGLSIGHVSPEAAEGGTIGLVEEGDPIAIDIPNRADLASRSTTASSPSGAPTMDAAGV